MSEESAKTSSLMKVRVRPDAASDFAAWQSKWHSAIAKAPGFIDLEIFCHASQPTPEWVIIQRFDSNANLKAWKSSLVCKELMSQVLEMTVLRTNRDDIHEEESSDKDQLQEAVTQVFVTHVPSEKVHAFLEWTGKMHETEAKSPGFRRVFVQAPKNEENGSWITLLQFDTQKNLDRWLDSKERLDVLSGLKECSSSIESHRVASSFAGWFPSVKDKAEIPALWKQTMLILLVLYPIVMLEFKFLNPYTIFLGLTLSTFIGNAISVTLVSWPLMPLAIYLLYWWLYPKSKHKILKTIFGSLIVSLLYLIEIGIFAYWNS